MSKKREFVALKERLFVEEVLRRMVEKRTELGPTASKKDLGKAIAADFGLDDYEPIVRLIYRIKEE